MATAAKRAKLIAKANAISKGVETQLSPETYRRDLLQALNYYNANHDDKEKKKWFISHYAKIDKKLAVQFLKIDEYHFRHAGVLARIMDGGSALEQKEADYFEKRVEFLKEQVGVKQKSEIKAEKKKYGFIQLELEPYTELKTFCDANGFKYSSFAAIAIRKYIKNRFTTSIEIILF